MSLKVLIITTFLYTCLAGLANGQAPEQPGSCPVNRIIGPCIIDENSCSSDSDCRPELKCCPLGCNRQCVDPVSSDVCPVVDCLPEVRCRYGFQKDAAGCKTCECINPCQDITCDEGEYCSVRSDCRWASRREYDCQYITACRPCRRRFCWGKSCPYGFAKGKNGCPSCECIPGPCDEFSCDEGERCKVDDATQTPSCVPLVIKEGVCSKDAWLPGTDCAARDKCGFDDDCTSSDKCCTGICGKTCTPIGFCRVPDRLVSNFMWLLKRLNPDFEEQSTCETHEDCPDTSTRCCLSLESLTKECVPALQAEPDQETIQSERRQLFQRLFASRPGRS